MNQIDFISKLANSHSKPNSADLAICKAVVDTLTEEETEKIKSCYSEIYDYICWRFHHSPTKSIIHYKSWQTYFKDLKLRKHPKLICK